MSRVALHAIPMQTALHAKLDGIGMLKINNVNPAPSTAKTAQRIPSLHYMPVIIVKASSIETVWVIACSVINIVKAAKDRGIIALVVPVAMD